MNVAHECAYAKINIALKITGKRENLHSIETLVKFISLCDFVNVTARTDKEINVRYHGLREEIENDNAKRAAALIMKRFGCCGADIEIRKFIPMRAGLGGSSADAAAVARAMKTLYGLPEIPIDILLAMGSDVPCMYSGKNCIVSGVGETVEEVKLPPMNIAVVVPDGGVSTAAAYSMYDSGGGETGDIRRVAASLKRKGSPKIFNALKKAAGKLNGGVDEALAMLKKCGFKRAGMTGSGSGVFGFSFDMKAFDSAVTKLKSELASFGNWKLIIEKG